MATELQKKFRKHYRKSMKLKEGGKAWEREISICEKLLAQARKEGE